MCVLSPPVDAWSLGPAGCSPAYQGSCRVHAERSRPTIQHYPHQFISGKPTSRCNRSDLVAFLGLADQNPEMVMRTDAQVLTSVEHNLLHIQHDDGGRAQRTQIPIKMQTEEDSSKGESSLMPPPLTSPTVHRSCWWSRACSGCLRNSDLLQQRRSLGIAEPGEKVRPAKLGVPSRHTPLHLIVGLSSMGQLASLLDELLCSDRPWIHIHVAMLGHLRPFALERTRARCPLAGHAS
jgi:hypothetical protein